MSARRLSLVAGLCLRLRARTGEPSHALNTELNLDGSRSGATGERNRRRLRRIDRSSLCCHIGGRIESTLYANMAADVRLQTLTRKPVRLLVLAIHQHVLIDVALDALYASCEVESFHTA